MEPTTDAVDVAVLLTKLSCADYRLCGATVENLGGTVGDITLRFSAWRGPGVLDVVFSGTDLRCGVAKEQIADDDTTPRATSED